MMKLKLVEQSNNYDCGTASLESLLSFYGISYDHVALEKLCESSPEHGTSPEGLIKGIKEIGRVPVEESPSSWKGLEGHINNSTPVMVEWYSDFTEPGDGHYSVVLDIRDNKIHLMDPELGAERIMGKEDFLRRWKHSEPENWSLYITN